jgi:hypothetical protein
MTVVLRIAGSVIALFILVGAVRAVTDDGDPQVKKVVRVAGEEVEIPNDTPTDIFSVTDAAMRKTGYLPWYRHCVIGQAERLLTPAEVAEYRSLPQAQRETRQLQIVLKVQPHCLSPGRDVLDPQATPEQLAPLREQTARSMRLLAAQEGLSRDGQFCAARGIRKMSDRELIELSNSPVARQEELLEGAFKGCA